MGIFQIFQLLFAGLSVYSNFKQADARKQEVEKQEQRETVVSRRERRQAIRRTILARENQRTAAQAAGFQGSGQQGIESSVASQLGGNLGFGTQVSGINQEITALGKQASTFGALNELSVYGGRFAASLKPKS